MIVASIRTATARPRPSSLKSRKLERHEHEEDADHHDGGARDGSGSRRDALLHGLVRAHAAVIELPDARQDEHVVVH